MLRLVEFLFRHAQPFPQPVARLILPVDASVLSLLSRSLADNQDFRLGMNSIKRVNARLCVCLVHLVCLDGFKDVL